MGKLFIQPGSTIELAGPQTVDAVVQVGVLAAVVLSSAASGEKAAAATEGVYEVPKRSADVMAQGSLVGWDNGNSEAVPDGDATEDFKLGVVWEAAGNGDTKVRVKLNARA